MSSFSTAIKIDAPVRAVWEVLADVASIYRWNPGVVNSHATTQDTTGLGACRHCDLGGNSYLDEEVVEWQADERLTMRITDTNLPFKTADIRFRLRAEGDGTVVTVSPEYRLRYGVLADCLTRSMYGAPTKMV